MEKEPISSHANGISETSPSFIGEVHQSSLTDQEKVLQDLEGVTRDELVEMVQVDQGDLFVAPPGRTHRRRGGVQHEHTSDRVLSEKMKRRRSFQKPASRFGTVLYGTGQISVEPV